MMKNVFKIFVVTFILALCSIVYELILAQALAAFLENTILRYSVTIGLYMFSMGIGASLAEGKFARNPLTTLIKVEILLVFLGGFSIVYLYCLDSYHVSRLVFSLFAHTLIVCIGTLTGFEIPLLMETLKINEPARSNQKFSIEDTVLAVNYAGAFLGTIIFAFLFYPVLGLIPSAFVTGFLNAFCGLLLFQLEGHKGSLIKSRLYAVQVVLFIVLVACLIFSHRITGYFLQMYLN